MDIYYTPIHHPFIDMNNRRDPQRRYTIYSIYLYGKYIMSVGGDGYIRIWLNRKMVYEKQISKNHLTHICGKGDVVYLCDSKTVYEMQIFYEEVKEPVMVDLTGQVSNMNEDMKIYDKYIPCESKRAVSSTGEKRIKLKQLRTFSPFNIDITVLYMKNDYLIVGSLDGLLNIYFKKKSFLQLHYEKIIGCSLSKNILLIQTEERIFFYDLIRRVEIKNQITIERNVISEYYFSRHSWTPDRTYVAVGMAVISMEYVVLIFSREGIEQCKLVGHNAPIESVAFCPRIFTAEDNREEKGVEFLPKELQSIRKQESIYLCAVASQDRSISLWLSNRDRPICVLEKCSRLPLIDLKWNESGSVLYAVSYDGSVLEIRFKKQFFYFSRKVVEKELEEILLKESVGDELQGCNPINELADILKINKKNFIEEQPSIKEQFTFKEQPSIKEQLSGKEQPSIKEQVTGKEQLSIKEQLTIQGKLTSKKDIQVKEQLTIKQEEQVKEKNRWKKFISVKNNFLTCTANGNEIYTYNFPFEIKNWTYNNKYLVLATDSDISIYRTGTFQLKDILYVKKAVSVKIFNQNLLIEKRNKILLYNIFTKKSIKLTLKYETVEYKDTYLLIRYRERERYYLLQQRRYVEKPVLGCDSEMPIYLERLFYFYYLLNKRDRCEVIYYKMKDIAESKICRAKLRWMRNLLNK